MTQVLLIAASEWRYWLQSYLVLAGALVFTLLLVVTSLLTGVRIEAENLTRTQQQSKAEATFLAQPDRHPHRMVHYGHYVFRAPAPLAIFDPGLDPITGQSIFLEGHRQNSAMFAESGASADLGRFSWLTPARIYQLFAPMLLILLGYSAIVREREAGLLASLLAQGVSGRQLVLGKFLALFSFALLLLTPLFVSGITAFIGGENIFAILLLLSLYLCYLMIWAMLTLLVSTVLYKRSTVLVTLATLWLSTTLVLPAIAVNVAVGHAPLAGKIETDFTMQEDIRKLGDGHNANDPAFIKLRADLLQQHEVARIEDLPVNVRGVVAMKAEEKLTAVLNEYASRRMVGEVQQATLITRHGWFTPTLALAATSRALSGTDLEHYHRFLKEAETVRFEFVQGLNRAHVHKLSYQDDINRNKDEASSQRARVDSDHWQHVLNAYQFTPASVLVRLENAKDTFMMLLTWFVILLAIVLWSGGRLKP